MSELNIETYSGIIKKDGIFFKAYGSARHKAYPVWKYHKYLEPIIVKNTNEDEAAVLKGYKHLDVTVERGSFLFNYMIDLEDFTERQLSVYIQDEFDLDLPPEAGIEKLIQAVWKLTLNHPDNKDRIVLLAQSVKMNYDETVLEIRKLASNFEETESEVFYA